MPCDCANGHVPIGYGEGWVSLGKSKPEAGKWCELYDSAFDSTTALIWTADLDDHLDGDYTAWRPL